MSSYFNDRDEKNIIKLRKILETFPSFVIEFFIGIQLRTTLLTRLEYAYDLRVFFNYLVKETFKSQNMSVKDITMSHINDITAYDLELFLSYIDCYELDGKKHRLGERGKQRKLATLRSFFRYYFKKDKLASNVAEKVDMPKIHQKPIIRLEPNEIVELLNMVESNEVSTFSKREKIHHSFFKLRDLAIVTLLLGLGIRVSECVGLNIDDIDFPNASLIITRKGGNKSILYFAKEIEVALKDYMNWLSEQKERRDNPFSMRIKDMDALFISNNGTRMTTRAIEMMVKKYSQIITPLKKITPHKLRSTYGTELYRQTQDIYIVAEVLGHKDINTTKKHYAATSEELKRKASKIVKLREDDNNE